MPKSIRSVAGHVLSTGQATDDEVKSLAAYALQDDAEPRTVKSLSELRQLLAKVSGTEGQHDRANMIQSEITRLEQK